MRILVSIIIPTFNRQGPVLRAINSVLNQSFNNFELIVVDDGSTDQTETWIKRYTDPRLKYYKTKNSGVSAARNFGVKKAQTDWICFLDSDDLWTKHKLSEQIRFHDKNKDSVISQIEETWIRNSKRINKMKKHENKEGNIFRESLRLCLISPSAVMLNKKLFEEVGVFDETMPACEDYDLWLRILAKHPVGFIDKPLVTKFGGHADQLSKATPILDQYRIYSLEKLLRSGKLSQEQEEWTKKELAYKKEIIEKGRKHETRTKPQTQ